MELRNLTELSAEQANFSGGIYIRGCKPSRSVVSTKNMRKVLYVFVRYFFIRYFTRRQSCYTRISG